jgi:hypothetical protein
MEIGKTILDAVESATTEKRLSCTEARKLATELNVAPKVIGDAANQLKIKIHSCELGCF